MAETYAGQVQYEERLIDATCMELVRHPGRFDVLLLPNLYGDIVSDLCAGLIGGLGVAPGINWGPHYAVFEAVHGSAPDLKGLGTANPLALVLSAKLMLDHIGEYEAASRIEVAVAHVIKDGQPLTRDLGGSCDTRDVIEAILKYLRTDNERCT